MVLDQNIKNCYERVLYALIKVLQPYSINHGDEIDDYGQLYVMEKEDEEKKKKKLFASSKPVSKFKKKLTFSAFEIENTINAIKATIYNTLDSSDIYDRIKWYAEFLRIAEKLFLYNNDEYCYIYSELGDKTYLLFIRSEDNEYKIRVKIEKTKIDNLLDDESNIEKLFFDDPKLTIITIDVVREYGKKMISSFKFPLGAEPSFNEESDKMLFNLVKKIIRDKIVESYISIIESTFKLMNVINLSEDKSYWENFKENGLWIKS